MAIVTLNGGSPTPAMRLERVEGDCLAALQRPEVCQVHSHRIDATAGKTLTHDISLLNMTV
jgi:hypothetical protein